METEKNREEYINSLFEELLIKTVKQTFDQQDFTAAPRNFVHDLAEKMFKDQISLTEHSTVIATKYRKSLSESIQKEVELHLTKKYVDMKPEDLKLKAIEATLTLFAQLTGQILNLATDKRINKN